jgi:predicted DNA-binding protein (MmcQ/YjbR family)
MHYDEAKAYLLARPEATEDYPFGPDVMVPKICGRMFATLGEEAGVARKLPRSERIALEVRHGKAALYR